MILYIYKTYNITKENLITSINFRFAHKWHSGVMATNSQQEQFACKSRATAREGFNRIHGFKLFFARKTVCLCGFFRRRSGVSVSARATRRSEKIVHTVCTVHRTVARARRFDSVCTSISKFLKYWHAGKTFGR